ncbi:hypothetical protein GCM10023083_85780 [Streptomyces phyllanthi]
MWSIPGCAKAVPAAEAGAAVRPVPIPIPTAPVAAPAALSMLRRLIRCVTASFLGSRGDGAYVRETGHGVGDNKKCSVASEEPGHRTLVARLKEEPEVPLRSHGSLSMNRALMAAALVDRVQVTLFPVITGQTVATLRGRFVGFW